MPFRIGVIGLGKIAQVQHIPALAADPDFELLAGCSPLDEHVAGVPRRFLSHAEMFAAVPELEAVAICTPPQVRHGVAAEALAAGKHVMLEKPPAATLSEFADLEGIAQDYGRVLFTAWHSRYNAAVDETRLRLARDGIVSVEVSWKEDVRKWHPRQRWIWQPGGFGCFDSGINALSVLTAILPRPIFVREAELLFPANTDAPIAASLTLGDTLGMASMRASFDWRERPSEQWEIAVTTETGGKLLLSAGGAKLSLNGETVIEETPAEYPALYHEFAALLRAGRSNADARPLRLVADAFLVGRRSVTDAFHDPAPGR